MEVSISVIVSIYNIEQYIKQCVDSILHQSYKPFEILLVNDGSSDNSLSICREYEKRNPNIIKVINKPNGGLSSARNAGIINAGGGYCYFVDGDDWIHERTLEHFVEILQYYGDLDFIHGRMCYFYDGDAVQNHRVQSYYIDNSWTNDATSGQVAFVNAYKKQGTLQFGVRGLYNREFLLKRKLLFVEKRIPWGEDEEWTPRLFLYAEKCAGSDKADYYYREKRVGSETSKMGNVDSAITMINTYANWVKLVEENNCSEQFKNTLLEESSRRYINTLIQNACKLKDNDLSVFLEYASQYKGLLVYTEHKGKMKVVVLLIAIFGVKITGKMIHWANYLMKKG